MSELNTATIPLSRLRELENIENGEFNKYKNKIETLLRKISELEDSFDYVHVTEYLSSFLESKREIRFKKDKYLKEKLEENRDLEKSLTKERDCSSLLLHEKVVLENKLNSVRNMSIWEFIKWRNKHKD